MGTSVDLRANLTEVTAEIPENGRLVLETRYLKKDREGRPIESPDDLFRRVACHVASAELGYDTSNCVEEVTEAFHRVMRALEFLPNSPTLMNAGSDRAQLSACFVLPVEDSLESVFEAVKSMALIHKSGGGTGFSFSRIRPKGDRVRTTQGAASGPVSFMRVFDAATEAVKQGGTRRGANMGILRVDHPDVIEFIDAKAGGRELRNFNISVAVTDAFMEALEAGADYSLVDPNTRQPRGRLNSRAVFRRVCERAWETGDPGIIFLDKINRENPTPDLGSIESTNPCGELPLLPYESCNLGSINLARMTSNTGAGVSIDYQRIARTVLTAIRFLDNVIDVNHYPMLQISAVTRGNRKIGLGIMGWADLLMRLGIPYASEQALTLADRVMGFIRRVAHRASIELAAARGPYPSFSRSAAGIGKAGVGRRNATVTTIAPTGTISIIAGCSSGIEPLFGLSFRRKHVLEGAEMSELHPLLVRELNARCLAEPALLEEIKRRGCVGDMPELPAEIRRRYMTALEIPSEWHVRMQAAFQKNSDNAVSKTVNLPFESTPDDVESVFRMAYGLGCKGITVYRDRCRETQVLNIGCAACA
jgi:ribonucleoside-diphosphate reductase alpha chain